MSDPIIGIDLGTSNTVVAYADSTGVAKVLADDSGYKIHPSVVSFHPSGGVVVGAAAKQRKVIDPQNTIYSVKRLIGRTYDSPEVQTARTRVPYVIKEGGNQLPLIVTRGGEFAIPEISAIVLDHARNVAQARLGRPVSRAVVTVPAAFTEAQRSATATAGAIAGLTVVRVLNEPTAAALAYGHSRNLREIIAVYDFGGGTFDVTLLRLEDQVYEVLGTAGDTFLGGDDIDERLVDKMVTKFLAENRIDLRTNEISMMRLRAVAEQTKIELSRRSRAVVRIDEIAYGTHGVPLNLQIELTRDELVSGVADIIERTFPVCQEALALAGIGIDQIADVILVGGTTKIPHVRDQVSKFFQRAPRTDVNPEDAVAIGAALQATSLERILARPRTSSRIEIPVVEEVTLTDTEVTSTPLPVGPTGPTGRVKRLTASYPAASERVSVPYSVQRTGVKERIETQPIALVPPAAPALGRMTRAFAPVAGTQPVPRPPTPGPRTTQPQAVVMPPPTPPRPAVVTPPPAPPTPLPSPAQTFTLEEETRPRTPTSPPPQSTPWVDDDLVKTNPAAAPVTAATTLPMMPTPPALLPPSAPTLLPPRVPAARSQFDDEFTDDSGTALPSAASTAKGFVPPRPAPAILDVTPRSLGIATVAGFCEELIRRNARVPTEMKRTFTTSRDSQALVRIVVCQGESRRLDGNVIIGDLVLQGLPARPRGETSIEVTFSLDASGILQVRALDALTGKEQRASLDVAGNVQEQDIAAARDRVAGLRR